MDKKAGKSLILRQLGEKVMFSGKETAFYRETRWPLLILGRIKGVRHLFKHSRLFAHFLFCLLFSELRTFHFFGFGQAIACKEKTFRAGTKICCKQFASSRFCVSGSSQEKSFGVIAETRFENEHKSIFPQGRRPVKTASVPSATSVANF